MAAIRSRALTLQKEQTPKVYIAIVALPSGGHDWSIQWMDDGLQKTAAIQAARVRYVRPATLGLKESQVMELEEVLHAHARLVRGPFVEDAAEIRGLEHALAESTALIRTAVDQFVKV
jgi:hypothetical protein